ncbi:MAG: type I restriction-modification system subunit M N-terminal domain-containing protein [Methanobacteriota archaeon]
MAPINFSDKVSFIWSVAELLRGPWKPNQYKDVMLPMVVIRRLDCVLEPTKDLVLEKNKELASRPDDLRAVSLNKITGHKFHNISNSTLQRLLGDPDNIAANFLNYIKGFSSQAQDIVDHFGFEEQIGKLEKITGSIW